MEFAAFSRVCEQLEGMSGRLEMIDLVASILPSLSDEELPIFVRFVMGRVFPDWSPQKLGIGPNLLYEAIGYVAGRKKADVVAAVNETGDVGCAVERLLATKSQTSFFVEPPTLGGVYGDLTRIAMTDGNRSQREKVRIIKGLLGNVGALEGRYLSRLLLEELRIGVGEGNVRDAIAGAFGVDAALVAHAHQALNDLGEVALLARTGAPALQDVHIAPFRPVKMMLAQQGTIAGMVEDHGAVAVEYKYDGTRFQFHKVGDECRMYSRRLEEVTGAVPDVIERLCAATTHDVILDGEVIAVRDGRPRPFQFVLRRFRRKHEVEAAMEEVELVPNVFDILYLDGETLIDRPLSDRRAVLEEMLSGYVAPQWVNDDTDALETIYQEALDAGHEGVMVKTRGAAYTPGVRGKNWIKVKPAVDTIDLAVVGAEWGEGRRAHLFGSFLLACQDEGGDLLPVGKVATGLSDEDLAFIFRHLKEFVIAEKGKEIVLEPKAVFEVGYAEVQESQNYASGYALRFPRFVRLREDKSVDEIETVGGVAARYEQQFKSL
ncbi:ATP-dependent DNA ligase [Methanofollis aquaemaris]|uniref:DNA ligase n=1 Tax=Methanofollis aquaemaris TaxID=126734 RepID=A0A8A3S6X8_9EURY|nr:ATP-dependent DNA ligase [Methanofollis aquaemaris]QSZ67693.1 ATP-dependent DNA ligase [Methanofollis aquaemaris]